MNQRAELCNRAFEIYRARYVRFVSRNNLDLSRDNLNLSRGNLNLSRDNLDLSRDNLNLSRNNSQFITRYKNVSSVSSMGHRRPQITPSDGVNRGDCATTAPLKRLSSYMGHQKIALSQTPSTYGFQDG